MANNVARIRVPVGKINEVYLVTVFMAFTWKMENQQSRGRGNRHKPGARFEFVSLGSVSCLPAAHVLSVHHGVAGIGYDTRPPRRHQGSHLQRLLCFVSDTFCAWRHACYLSNRPGWALDLSAVCALRVIREARFSLFFLLMNSSTDSVQSVTHYSICWSSNNWRSRHSISLLLKMRRH